MRVVEGLHTPLVEALLALGVALAVGLLLGAERQRGEGQTFGGIRTFPLYSLAGALGSLLGVAALASFAICIGALLVVAYVRESERKPEDLGMSTEIAAVGTFGLGALCTARGLPWTFEDRMLIVASAATAMLALLALKAPLHGIVARLSLLDVYTTVKLLLLAVIVLPLLPNADLGPWNTLNPRQIGLLIVLVLTISFGGYVAIRMLGARRGLVLTGVLGGLASSTAVTLVLSRRARSDTSVAKACAAGIAFASATMFPRVLAEIYVVEPTVADALKWVFLGTAATSFVAASFLYLWMPEEDSGRPSLSSYFDMSNPLSVSGALKFGTVFAVVVLVGGAATHEFDIAGAYGSAAVTGLVDADAVALSLARMHRVGLLDQETTLLGIAIGAAANTLGKVGIAAFVGGRRVAIPLGLALLPALGVLAMLAV